MSRLDRMRKKYEVEKMTLQVIDSPKFKEVLKEHEEKAVLHALARFTFMMCGFLETRHGYKANGLKKFLKSVLAGLKETEDNSDFFIEYENYYKDEYDLDVLAELGLGLEEKV